VIATFTAGRTDADIRVALIDRPEMLDWVLTEEAPELRPELIVLGETELATLAGGPVIEPWEAVAAIERLRGFRPESVLASLGAAGAVLVSAGGAFHAEFESAADDAFSLDALLSGFLTAGADGPEALVAALLSAASGSDPLPAVHVTWIDALELARACTP
jgi:fructose-1-phosphate kinase PfkB-like protein